MIPAQARQHLNFLELFWKILNAKWVQNNLVTEPMVSHTTAMKNPRDRWQVSQEQHGLDAGPLGQDTAGVQHKGLRHRLGHCTASLDEQEISGGSSAPSTPAEWGDFSAVVLLVFTLGTPLQSTPGPPWIVALHIIYKHCGKRPWCEILLYLNL